MVFLYKLSKSNNFYLYYAKSFYIFLQILIHIIYTVTEVSVSCKLTNNIQKSVFYEACKRDYLSLGSYHTGELVNRITADSKIVSDGVMYLIPTSVLLASQVVFSFYELVKLDAQLAVICLLAFPLVTVAVRFYGIRMKNRAEEEAKKWEKCR